MWDVNYDFRDLITRGQLSTTTTASQPPNTYRILYCPSNPVQMDPTLYNFTPNVGVMGYFFMTKRYVTGGGMGGNFPPANTVTYIDKTTRNYTDVLTGKVLPQASTVVASDGTLADSSRTNYTAIQGGWTGGKHTTSHMKGAVPAGRNILYLDSHAEWSAFQNATSMAGYSPNSVSNNTVCVESNGSPYFFW
jgi:hypothetical protein